MLSDNQSTWLRWALGIFMAIMQATLMYITSQLTGLREDLDEYKTMVSITYATKYELSLLEKVVDRQQEGK
jgi:hypothetical protein